MKLLEKKIYGFTILEIGIGAFILMNLKTIMSIFSIATKPIENAVEAVQDAQVKKEIPNLTNDILKKIKEMAPIIKDAIGGQWDNTDEVYLSKYIGDNIKNINEWNSLKTYYKLTYNIDLPASLKSVLTNFWGEGYYEQQQYKKLIKHSFIIKEIW